MKPIYTVLTTLVLLTFCLAGSAAAQRLLDEHEVVRENEDVDVTEGHPWWQGDGDATTRDGDIITSTSKHIHDVSESQAKSTVSSSVSISCNVDDGSFVGVAQIKGSASTKVSAFLASSYDQIDSSGIPVTLTTKDLNKYQGESGNADKTAYVVRPSGINNSLLYTGIKRHGVLLEKGTDILGVPLFSKRKDLNFSADASTVAQKSVDMTDDEILAMFSPYASASGSAQNNAGQSIENQVPSVSAHTDMKEDTEDGESEDDEDSEEEGVVQPPDELISGVTCLGGCGDVIPATVQSSYHLVKDCEGCGEDYYSCKQGAAHAIIHNVYAPTNLKCGHLYRLCASGDHGLKQASCATDANCIATDFWLCQHTSHVYAEDLPPGTEAPTVPTTLTCRNFHTYSTTDSVGVAYHAEVKTCTRCGVSYVECDALDPAKSGCSAGYVWHTTEVQPVAAPAPDPPPSVDPPSVDPPVSVDPPDENENDSDDSDDEEDSDEVEEAPSAPSPPPPMPPTPPPGNTTPPPGNTTPPPGNTTPPPGNTTPPPGNTTPSVLCGNSNRGSGKCIYNRVASSKYEHQTTCLAGHTYWSCNVTAVSSHSGHRAPAPAPPPPKVVCPADSWTNCGGTVSHSTTCGWGHTYYTCNADAVSSHSWHTASQNNSSQNNSSSNNSSSNNSSQNNSSSNNSSSNNSSSNNSSSNNSSGNNSSVPPPPPPSPPSGNNSSVPPSSNNSSQNNSSSNNSSSNNSSQNNSSSNNSSSNNSSAIVCPANGWTQCRGTMSHAAVCGRGHTYYTCNPKAVQSHAWH